MGRFHAARLSENKTAEFVGCFDIDDAKSAALSKEYRVKKFEDIDSLRKEIEAVSIAVPTTLHFEVASMFLEAGVAVLLEKPIAADLESAKKLVELSESKKVLLQIGHSERFNPAFLAVKDGISDPKFIEIHRLAPFKGRGVDVPVIFDLMIHDLDLIMALTGSVPEKIEAAGVAVITNTVDIANARLSFPNGCVANVTASRISVKEMRKLRVFQRSGYTSIDMATREAEQFIVAEHNDADYKKSSMFNRLSLQDGRAVVRKKIDIPSGDNLRFEISSFLEAVRGAHPAAISGRDGYNVLVVATEIERRCAEYLKRI
ncbi:MAG TPA: oxidoreductase [candidate division Zixibacteria bacterium]|nr:oxidoreductase [candidate division Zixibacteria bacterium]HBZ00514.1 oxidoreductase [candidate division Zixibacteria bacterium]